jgi:methylenetetrahydrofolate reductase (NADPH)
VARIVDLLAAGRTVSFEFFPPKTDGAQMTLGRTIAELEPLDPSFVSVTYGAGGSTRERTHQVVTWVRKETSIAPMAHLTCQGHTRAEVTEILENYRAAGVENILALGGDPPKDPAEARPSDYRYASELVDHITEAGDFSIGVAAHPELHPRSPDRATDRRMLAAKLAAADFAITQFFFELEPYVRLVNELADLGVTKPVLPGIMPVTNTAQITRMAEMSGAAVPGHVRERLEAAGGDPEHTRRIGVEIATELASDLLDAGAPGLHFYTLNRSTATREVHANLGLSNPASATAPEQGVNLGTGAR